MAMDRLVAMGPDPEEVIPNGRKCTKSPVGASMGACSNVTSPEELVLSDAPLGTQMTVKQVAPPNGRLFVD